MRHERYVEGNELHRGGGMNATNRKIYCAPPAMRQGKGMNLRIAMCQMPLGISLVRREIETLRRYRPHFVCFPEYFFVNVNLGNHAQTPHNQSLQLRRIQTLSRCLETVVIGGTMPERNGTLLHNTTFVFHNGTPLGYYRKKHLFFAEEGVITPGERYQIFEAYGIRFGVLICADVFDDEGFIFMRDNGVRIIFSPTFSLKKQETVEDKYRRDQEIYVRGAKLSGAFIVKVCGVKSPYRNFLQARSLIAGPEGIIYRVHPEEEDRAMIIRREITV